VHDSKQSGLLAKFDLFVSSKPSIHFHGKRNCLVCIIEVTVTSVTLSIEPIHPILHSILHIASRIKSSPAINKAANSGVGAYGESQFTPISLLFHQKIGIISISSNHWRDGGLQRPSYCLIT
jgi:hypothetical protein